MNVQEVVLPEGRRVRVAPTLSREALRRLKWMDYYRAHGRNASHTWYPAVRRVHFTARDMVSRKDVPGAYKVGNSSAAANFLREALPRMGFPIRALQIDGGSEFKAHFEPGRCRSRCSRNCITCGARIAPGNSRK